MEKYLAILFCYLLSSSAVVAQIKNGKNGHNGYNGRNGSNGHNGYYYSNGIRAWQLLSLSGEVKTGGFYREQELFRGTFQDVQKSTFINGGALIRTKSFFVHPKFLICDIDAGYYPETYRNIYIIVPEQAQVKTLNKVDFRGTLLKDKKVSLILFANFDNSYQNREFITDIKSNSRQWGGALYYRNKLLPVSLNYRERTWKQAELLVTSTNREVTMDERMIQGKTSKSFITRDRHELNYTHNESVRQNIFTDQNTSSLRVKNITDDIQLHSNIPIDAKRKYLLNSLISDFNQRENREFNRFQALESVTLKLPGYLTFLSNYDFIKLRNGTYDLTTQNIRSSLGHKLYENLDSRIFFENTGNNHTAYKENIRKTGLDLQYNKKIPTKGRLSLSYTFFKGNERMSSSPSPVQFSNEEHILTDGQMVLLNKPYVDQNSVVARDASGAIIYQLNLDYVLVDRYPYLEIVRVPGGLIANNAKVYIDYTAIQPGSYAYGTDNHVFSANVFLFKRKLEFYYRMASQDYNNETNTEFLILNYYTRNVTGARIDFGFINGGAEYTDYSSTIVPYRMIRYFINIQKNYREKLSITLNGNMQDYHLVNENINQKYTDVNGRISYKIFKQTHCNINLLYRQQEGLGIDLDMMSAKGEIVSVIRKFSLTAGAELYRRVYVGEKINLKGVYVQMARKF